MAPRRPLERAAHPTDREQQVLTLIWTGLASREIGERLGITKRTVEVHRASLMKKARCTNVVQLIRWGMQYALLPGR